MQLILLALLIAPPTLTQDSAPALTSFERDAGWRELFDGRTTAGWRGYGKEGVPAGWSVLNGTLTLDPAQKPGDLVTDRAYENFELEFEWRVAKGANSGVKVRVKELAHRGAPLGPEYQILDDVEHANGLDAKTSAGALYALYPAETAEPRSVGEWNHSRLVYRNGLAEHWLNGQQLFRTEIGGEDWERRKAASKFKDVADFGLGAGHIALQDHGGAVSFRTIRIRDWDRMPGEAVTLFPGEGTEGWRPLGNAVWTRIENGVIGEVGGGAQSFLVTERTYGDFILELDLKIDAGNSGVQVRSQVRENGSLFGYQIEIDPSQRAWSGGLFDEGRRAWLDDLQDEEAARAAFRVDGWNHYRIECIGPSIRSWVNGVPAADYLDAMDLEGVIGLQVHSGRDARITWKNMRLIDLGRRHWRSVELRDKRLFSTAEAASGHAAWAARVRWSEPLDLRLYQTRIRKNIVDWQDEDPFRMFPEGPVAWIFACTGDTLPAGDHELFAMSTGRRLTITVDGDPRVRMQPIHALEDGPGTLFNIVAVPPTGTAPRIDVMTPAE